MLKSFANRSIENLLNQTFRSNTNISMPWCYISKLISYFHQLCRRKDVWRQNNKTVTKRQN